MAQTWAKKFYESKLWQVTRDSVYAEQHGVCQKCNGNRGAGEIVHHIIHLTRNNIHDINITLNKDNLMLVCRCCHGLLHGSSNTHEGLMFNKEGEVVEDN